MPAAAHVLDLGCGFAGMLIELLKGGAASAIGVDHNPLMLAEARERAAQAGVSERLTLIESSVEDYGRRLDSGQAHPPDVLVFFGSGGLGEVPERRLRRLRDWLAPNGRLLWGELYWRREPKPAYLSATGFPYDMHGSLGETAALVDRLGMSPVTVFPAAPEDWDTYEWALGAAVERLAKEFPEDPAVKQELLRRRAWLRSYLHWGRDTLGFAGWLLSRV